MTRLFKIQFLTLLMMLYTLSACGGLSAGEVLTGGQSGFANSDFSVDVTDESGELDADSTQPFSGSQATDESLDESSDLYDSLEVQHLPVTIAKEDEETTNQECDAEHMQTISISPDSAEMHTFGGTAALQFQGLKLSHISEVITGHSNHKQVLQREFVFFVEGDSDADVNAEICDTEEVAGETEYVWRSLTAEELSEYEVEMGSVRIARNKVRLSDTYTQTEFHSGERHLKVTSEDFGDFQSVGRKALRYIVLRHIDL